MQFHSDSYQVRVFYEDTDAGGNVYHANYVKFCERARTEWLRKLGISQSFFLEQNSGFVVRKLELDCKAPAKLDDLLIVTTTITQLKRATVCFEQVIVNEQGKVLCQLDVVIAYVNLQQAKPCKIPEQIIGAFQRAC